MIYLIIGQSASGKTSYVKEHFFDKNNFQLFDKPIKYTVSKENILIGHYGIGRRCEGTDTISYNRLDSILNFLATLDINSKNVILEGDRVNSTKVIDFLKRKSAKVILFNCSLETSMMRLALEKSTITETFVRTTRTKAYDNYLYARNLGIQTEAISTEVVKNGLFVR